jgi:hypothetical protein
MIVKARFDGRVFVPDEPVNLAPGQTVSLLVEPAPAGEVPASTPLLHLIDKFDRLPGDPDWPEDAAAQHDHYLYGAPRRP